MYRIFELDQPAMSPSYEIYISVVHPQDRELVNRAHTDLVTNKAPYAITHRLRMNDGRIKYVHERGDTHFDVDGRPIRAAGIIQDVTDRFEAQERMRASNELLSTVFESSHTLIAYLDRDMNFVRVNRAYAAADGKSTEFFVGKNHFALYPNEENEAIFRRVAATGEAHSAMAKPFEYEHNLERGLSHWDWTLVPVKGKDGAVTGLVLSLLDVTDRINTMSAWMHAKQELKTLNDSLELRIAERTSELIAAKEEADRANRAKTEFLSRMSHELRTPLNAILGYAQVLHSSALDDGPRDFVAEMLSASEHLLGVVDKLLDLGRIEGGTPEQTHTPASSSRSVAAASVPTSKVVYIEDNVANLRLMQQIFARHLKQVELLSASGAMDGVRLVREHHPSLVLMDINLPGTNGFEALGQLQADPRTRHIPVVAVSADAMPQQVERGLRAGFRGYVTKPIVIKELIGTIANHLGA